jgi:hypothetical protein
VNAALTDLSARAVTPAEHVAAADACRQHAAALETDARTWEAELAASTVPPALRAKNPALLHEKAQTERRVSLARHEASQWRERAQWHLNRATELTVTAAR